MGLTKEQREKLMEKAGQKQQEHAGEQKPEKTGKKGFQLPKGLKKPPKKALMIGGGVAAVLVLVVAGIMLSKTGVTQQPGGATGETANKDVSMVEGVPEDWAPSTGEQQQYESVRLTADLIPDISEEDVKAQVEALSWFDGVLNSDGSVTYTMTPDQLAAMQTSVKDGLEKLKTDYAAQGIEVTISDDWLTVTVKGPAETDRTTMLQAAEQIARQVRLCAVYHGERTEQTVTVMSGDTVHGEWYWTDLQAVANEAVPVTAETAEGVSEEPQTETGSAESEPDQAAENQAE